VSYRNPRDPWDPRWLRETRDPRQARNPRDSRQGRDPRDGRRDPRSGTDPKAGRPAGGPAPDSERGQEEGFVVRDKRRIDPVTGTVRESAPPAPGPASEPAAGSVADGAGGAGGAAGSDQQRIAGLEAQVAERTADLQRLQAEYQNYRRRVERDRDAVRELAVSNVLANLLPILDDIGRARDHGELEGGFRSVGEALEATVEKLGLAPFGEAGERFDPMVHEALMHSYSTDVTEPTAVAILQPGYRFGDRIVRPARVAVAEPADETADATDAVPAEPVTPVGDSDQQSGDEPNQ
jgi:molecular chaperone GrpE